MLKILEPFQKIGADFLVANPHALLADQPGLGKTLQAIAAAEIAKLRRVLVICPASVRANWHQEIEECLGSTSGWCVLSYNAAVAQASMSSLAPVDLVILDEVHFLKTADSQRTLAVFGNNRGLARRARYKWCLTGTPVLNRPRELYPMLKTLCPVFKETIFARFAQRYCGAFFDGRALNTKGASHIDELAAMLQGFMLRRTKREVYPDRTAPLIHRIPLELSVEDLKTVVEEENLIGGRETRISSRYDHFSQLGDTSRLLRLLGEAKVRHVVRFVEDLLETVEKVVIFAHHTDVIRRLAEHFSKRGDSPVVYQGGMSDEQKTAALSRFAYAGSRVFVGQRQAAGIGINGLQKVCSTVVIAEPSWVPGETEQMIDRLDRIGQQDDLVTAYILYTKGTLDEVVVRVHDGKQTVIDQLMRGRGEQFS